MNEDKEGFLYPQVSRDSCNHCALCEKVCPIVHTAPLGDMPKAFACYSKNQSIRMKSSSGGVFSLIASEVIKDNGVVFGAGFDKDFNVEHSYVEKIEDLERFVGSKYVQSKIGNAYKEAKKFLGQGRKVLFTGTPCQIEGLRSFLQKSYDNLICQDLICHGVPSPMVWRQYKKYITKGNKIKDIYFRNKDLGWNTFSLKIEMEECIYTKSANEDSFMRAFLTNLCLRPSCYYCSFKTLQRRSDITLADFWGIERILPCMSDDKGTSLVFANSQKGMDLLRDIYSEVVMYEVNLNEAIEYNTAAYKSVELTKKRTRFFKHIGTMPFDKLVYKSSKESKLVKGKQFLRNTGSKVKRMLFS
jgi:coenzyme F420-reducing hydrogenase beta subunit